MHLDAQVFFALLLAHLLGDFPFQTGRMVAGKKAFQAAAYLRHGLAHLLLAAAALALFTPVSLGRPAVVGALALLTGGHLLLDLAKSGLIRWRPAFDRTSVFVVDQALHVIIVAAATLVIVGAAPVLELLWPAWVEQRDRILLGGVIVIATVFPAGYFIRYLLMPLSRELAAAPQGDSGEAEALKELSNAGLYLGWLERAILVVAFAAGSFTAVGLIVGAKSVVRFPEFKSRAFAEYFILGTLTSVAVAAVGGWLLRGALAMF